MARQDETKANEGAGRPEPERVRIGDVCDLADDRALKMAVGDRGDHRGPYPLYAQDCSTSGIDDYTFEAVGTVIVSALGQVFSTTGGLIAALETGRCSVMANAAHALVPHDASDAAYVWRVLTTMITAERYAIGSPQLRQLTGSSLKAIPIPWPDAATRRSYVLALDELDERRASLRRRIADLYARGDEAYARVAAAGDETRALGEVCEIRRGTDVPARERSADKPVRVEIPAGCAGRCDEALTQGPVIVIGPAARRLVAHLVDEPCHPIAEMAFVEEGGEPDLATLLFALRHAGVLDHVARGEGASDVPRRSVDDLAGLSLALGTPRARADFAPVGRSLVAQIAQATRELERERELRASLVRWYFSLPQGEEPRLSPLDYVRLDRLVPVVEACPAQVTGDDLAWEVAPLATLRRCLEPASWDELARVAREDEGGVVAAIDSCLGKLAAADDLLAFLPNLGYASSLLTPAQLAGVVGALDAIDRRDVSGPEVRALFALGGEPAAPAGVAALLGNLASYCAGDADEGAYVPYEDDGTCADALARELPQVTVRAQFDSFEHVLSAALVRAVQAAPAGELRGGMGAAASSALASDEFGDWKARVVLAIPPCNQGQWTAERPSKDDPRWVLGTPPRTKANFAWLETALAHQAPGGATILVMSDRVLHATAGSEPVLRRALIEQRRVRCVVSLPARIFADGRQASCVLVLGDEGSAPQTLFVDALGEGVAVAHPWGDEGGVARYLPVSTVESVARTCRAWLERGELPDEHARARVLCAQEILDRGARLAPWDLV